MIDRQKLQVRDYVRGGIALFWQRQVIFLGASILTAFYIDYQITLYCYFVLQLSEMLDLIVFYSVLRWRDRRHKRLRRYLRLLTFTTITSSSAIALYAVMIAAAEGPGLHFTPLFFLFAAAIFAAMNNHQLFHILVLRLSIYALAFLWIPLHDIWMLTPPLSSVLWLQFLTSIFILYFSADCARVFLKLYKAGLIRLEQLQAEHDKALLANEAKSQFVATVSHELRTPLTSINGALQFIRNGVVGEVPDKMRRLIDMAVTNSEKLSCLINDILDFQKLESGEMSFDFARIELGHLVEEAVEGVEGFSKMMDVEIDLKRAGEAIFVNADRVRLSQVLTNILSNALKFSNEGGRVTVEVARFGGRARVTVIDRGCGLPEDARDKVFDRFSQVDGSVHRKVGGTGLGMSISKSIMDYHDGIIDFDSELGKGTSFYIELEALTVELRAVG